MAALTIGYILSGKATDEEILKYVGSEVNDPETTIEAWRSAIALLHCVSHGDPISSRPQSPTSNGTDDTAPQ